LRIEAPPEANVATRRTDKAAASPRKKNLRKSTASVWKLRRGAKRL
jgi:hypothetical protein